METGRLLDRFDVGTAQGKALIDDYDVRPDKYQAFRTDPQARPSVAMLDFWFSDGNQRAIAYTHLYDIAYNVSEGLELTFSGHVVTIRGYGLNDLYRGLKRHRIVFIWEADTPTTRIVGEQEPVVTKILIQPRQEFREYEIG